jgi:hypothetical protein
MQLRSVGVLSVAKIMGAIYGLLGLLFIPIFLIAAAAGMMGAGDNKMAGAAAGVGLIVVALLMPIMYGVMGFVGGAIGAFLYNFLAGRLGGIEMNLQPHTGQAVRAAGV